jgi:hypothetical protein
VPGTLCGKRKRYLAPSEVFRPVGESERKNMLTDLFAKLDKQAASQKIEK